MGLQQIEAALTQRKSRYDKAVGQRDLLIEERRGKAAELGAGKSDIAVWEQVQALFSKVSEFAREQLKLRIQETVTAALQAVLARDDISFEVVMRSIGGKPAAEWSVQSVYGDMVIAANPEDGRGGGVADVVSLALRLALLELARPRPVGPIVLDEPGKMVSKEYLPNVAEFLKQYAEQTGRQIVMVTHHEDLAEVADVSYRVTQSDGVSEVSKG